MFLYSLATLSLFTKKQSQYLRESRMKNSNLGLPDLKLYSDVHHQHHHHSKVPGATNTTSVTTKQPRVVVITPLQYVSSNSDPRPVLSSHTLKVDTTSSLTTKQTDFTESSIPTRGAFVEPSWYKPNAHNLLWNKDRCEVQHPWQLEGFPNCNNLHELDMRQLKLITSGTARTAFESNQHLGDGKQAKKFVYKTIMFHRDVSMHSINQQRKDALVLERSSHSNFIPDLHGYCSVGLLMDFMPEGNMWDYLKGARLSKKRGDRSGILSPVDKLRVAIHIASGVRDLHETSAFFHNDICCHQFLFQNGIFKLNDFNYAQPITLVKNNSSEHELCLHDDFGMAYWKGRNFEEHLRRGHDPRFEPLSGDKVDIYMMGILMYTILTELFVFEKPRLLTIDEVRKELLAGRQSPYPDDIENSNDAAHSAVKMAIEMCWTKDWRKRPSSKSITEYLMGELQKITEEASPDVRITMPPRDPGQTLSEGDYDRNAWI